MYIMNLSSIETICTSTSASEKKTPSDTTVYLPCPYLRDVAIGISLIKDDLL